MECPYTVKTYIYKTGKRPIHFQYFYCTPDSTLGDFKDYIQSSTSISTNSTTNSNGTVNTSTKKIVLRQGLQHSLKKRGLGVLFDYYSDDDKKTLQQVGFKIGDLMFMELFDVYDY